MSEDKDMLNELAGEATAPAPATVAVVETPTLFEPRQIKDADGQIVETIDSLEPTIRVLTGSSTKIKLLDEVLTFPKSQVLVRCLVHCDKDDQRSFILAIRGDDMFPRYSTTREAKLREFDQKYIVRERYDKVEAPVALDAEGNKVVAPEVLERLAKARVAARAGRGRTSDIDYSKVPDTILCSKCTAETNLGKYQIGGRAKKAGVTIEAWIADYLCPVCNPVKKGKQVSAKWAGLPTELHCHAEGCSFVKKQHPSATEIAAKAADIGFNAYVATWLCKEHKVKKAHQFSKEGRVARGEISKPKVEKPIPSISEGHKHRGRVADPRWAGMAKELICKGCGAKKIQHPSITLKAAIGKKLDYEFYVDTWKCKACKKLDK